MRQETELEPPARSACITGRLPGQAPLEEQPHALDSGQIEWLLDRSRWIFAGSRTLRFRKPEHGRPVAAWVRHWPPGAFRLLCRLGLECGLRPGEALWLHWSELQLDTFPAVLRLQNLPCRRLKNRWASQPLTIPADLARELLEFREALRRFDDLREYVFAQPCRRGHLGWRPPEQSFVWRALREECGDRRLRYYSLRHTFITRLAEWAEPLTITKLARHSDLKTTLQYYVERSAHGEALCVETGRRVRPVSSREEIV